jgi:hypothetical protein
MIWRRHSTNKSKWKEKDTKIWFLDDATVLTLALSKLVTSITPAIKATAKAQLHEWFDFEEAAQNIKPGSLAAEFLHAYLDDIKTA